MSRGPQGRGEGTPDVPVSGRHQGWYLPGETIEIGLEPDLSHCVETVAKKEHERVLSVLLKEHDEDGQLEDELELLRLFPESADFRLLRSHREESLPAGKRVVVRLRSKNGMPQ
jgi:hypothetical protein